MIKAAAYNCEALQNPFIFDEVYKFVSPQRRAHVDEAKTLKGKCERLGAAHLLEKLLWENHIQRPYVYSTTSQGKPIFIQPKNVDFSISHSNFFAVAAISDKPVGIDVERIRPYDRDLVERFFTKSLRASVRGVAIHKVSRKKRFSSIHLIIAKSINS